MLYHVSPTPGLKTLRPRVSTHKKPYVYAIENRETALLFGAKQDDFDFIISTLPDGRPCICECRPNVFQEVYQGKSCSVYEVSETGFLRGITGWEPELVCGGEVPVLRETAVHDLYQTLLAAEKENARLLRQAVDELPSPDREIFIRRYYLYERVKEIAARLGLPEKTVENRLFRGRRRLRQKLLERGVIL